MTYFKVLITAIFKGQKTCHLYLIIILTAGLITHLSAAIPLISEGTKNWFLRYEQPAQSWTEALPIGNGRMGAMVYGRVKQEKIQFNHDEIWTGQPTSYQHPGAADVLPELRRLLFLGKQKEAEQLAQQRFMSLPLRQCAYQPFGDLILNFEHGEDILNYQRSLDLENALANVSYMAGGINYSREIFASYPDQIIVVRLTANKPNSLSFTLSLTSPHPDSRQFQIAEDILGLTGRVTQTGRGNSNNVKSELSFQAQLKIRTENGEVLVSDSGIEVKKADTVTLILTGAGSYVNYRDISGDPAEVCRETLSKLDNVSFAAIKKRHLEDYRSLFHRVDINLGVTEAINNQTHLRVKDFPENGDPHLVALLFQYGRYLLIASSRPGSQPANLQGLWNDRLDPPWESKYTVNINTEMNYWLAEVTNLSQCHEPLFDLIEECAQTGAQTAKTFYNCRGWVLHHNTDIWRGTAAINASNHGIWATGGAWLSQHLWWHYDYTRDMDFLRTRAYPILKEGAKFFIDYLIEDPRNDKGWLISGPSNSPENGGLVMGPTMDHQIIRNLLSNSIRASEILDIDAELRAKWLEIKSKIAPNQIGQYGQLQEWLEDRDDPNNKHRHVSHLWGLFPGREITREKTPELFEAAKQSLEFRGDEGTGWSMGWKINFWARLGDGNRAYKVLQNLLKLTGSAETEYRGGGIYPNLFDAHPPFQIDGNFGATAGIAEMLLQSHEIKNKGDAIIHLLPALPSVWPDGYIKGLCARGGFEVAIKWQKGLLVSTEILSKAGGLCTVSYENLTNEFETQKGKTYKLDRILDLNDR